MSLANSVKMVINSVLTGTTGLASGSDTIAKTESNTLSTATKVYTVSGALVGGSKELDLSGSLTDPRGGSAVFTKVQCLYFKNTGAAAMTLGGANNVPIQAIGDIINVPAGASIMYLDATGVAVTAGSGDLITVTGTGSDTFEIIVIGQ